MIQPNKNKVREIVNDSMNRKLTKVYGDINITTSKDNTNIKIIKPLKTLSKKAEYDLADKANKNAYKNSNEKVIKENVFNSMTEVYKHPLSNPGIITPEGIAINTIKSIVRLPKSINDGNTGEIVEDVLGLLPEVGNIAKQAKNIYKINPLAEKLATSTKSYRVASLDSFDDFKASKVLRSKSSNKATNILERIEERPTSFPSFQKGKADLNYLPKEGGVVYETELPTYKRGDINPVTQKPIKGRHYAHRVLDKAGNAVNEIPAKSIKVFDSKPHWLKGYQEIKDEIKIVTPKKK